MFSRFTDTEGGTRPSSAFPHCPSRRPVFKALRIRAMCPLHTYARFSSEFELTGAADDDSLGITQLMATLQGRMHISCSLASASPSIFMRPEPIAAVNKKYVTTNPNFSLSSFYPVDIPQSRPSRVRVSTPRNVKGGKARRFERSPSMRYSKKNKHVVRSDYCQVQIQIMWEQHAEKNYTKRGYCARVKVWWLNDSDPGRGELQIMIVK